MEPPCQDYGSTSESPETTELEDDRSTRHEQATASTPLRQATTSSLERKGRGGEADVGEIIPPKQNQSEAAKSVVKSVDVTLSPRSGHANGSISTDTNHKLRKRKHQDVPPSLLEDEGPSQVKKARNHVSKTVSLNTAAPKKVQKPRKKPRSVIPRALRKKPNNTVRSHSHSDAKSSPDTSVYDWRRPIESSAHQCHSKNMSVAENGLNSRTTHGVNASNGTYTLTNPSPHKLRGISPEIPLQSDSSSHSLMGRPGHVSSNVESNSTMSKPSRRLYDSEESSQTTDDQSESYSEDDWKPPRVKKKKFMRHKTMKAAGLVIDDILKIRKQSSRTVLYDCIGSPKGKKGSHSPKRRLSLITRDTPKSERWAGPSARKPLTLAPSFLGSPATLQVRNGRTEKSNTKLTQVTLGGSNEKHDDIPKAVLPSTDSSTEADEQDGGSTGEMSKDSNSEKIGKATWLKKLPKRQLTVQLDKEIRLEGNHSGDGQVQSPKPLLELKSSEAGPVEDTRVKQRMLSQQSDEGSEMSVDPLVCATLNGGDKDKDEQSSNKASNIGSKQNTIPSSEEDLEDAIVDVLGIDSVDEENTNGGARANLRQNFTRIRLTDADFTTGGDSTFPGLEDNTSTSSEDEMEDGSKQQNRRLSDDDMQEPIDVLGLDDAATTSSNTEDEGNSESDQAKPPNLAQKLSKPKPTMIKLTDADLTTEGSLLQEEGDWRRDGALGTIEDSGGDDGDDDSSNGHSGSTMEPAGGEGHNSNQQTSKKLTGKDIHDIMIASSQCGVDSGTIVSEGDNSSKPTLKQAVTNKKKFVDQSSLHNVRVVLDALPVCKLPVWKPAIIVNSDELITKDKKKGTKKKKLKGGATKGDVISRGVQAGAGGKVAKRTKSGQDSKPSKRTKVTKQLEDDSDDIVVKDLVEDNDSEDYRVKLKLVSKQKPQEEKKLSTKPTRFIPLSGPMGIASSAEDDDVATNNGKTGQKLRTVEHTSNLNATDKKPTVKTVVQEGEGGGMEIGALLAAISEGSGGMEVDSLQAVISDGHVSEKTMQAEADIMTHLSQNHHRKTVGETSSVSTVPVANTTTFQSRGMEEHNYSQTDPTATIASLTQNQEGHRSKTVGEASLDALVISPIIHSLLRSLEEHNYSRTAPTLTASSLDVPQNQTEHQSETTPSTACILPSQNTQSKTIGEASSKSIGTDSTTYQPCTCGVEEHSDKSSATAIASGLSRDKQSKTVSSKLIEKDSTTDQAHNVHVKEHSDGNSAAAIMSGLSRQNHQSKAVPVGFESTVARPTNALVSWNRKDQSSKTNPTPSSLSQNLQKRDSKTVGEASSKSTATTTNSTTRVLPDQAKSNSALAYPITAALLPQDQPRSKSAVANPTSAPLLAQNLVDVHRKTLGTSTCSTAVTVGKDAGSNSSSRNTTGNSSAVMGVASVTMATSSATSRLTSITEDSGTGESTLQPKKRRTKLLNRTKASSGFQLSVVEDKKVGVVYVSVYAYSRSARNIG